MLLNYLKLAIRLLIRNPFFTFINVAGLSVGFAVFFILWPFTESELSSDQFIKDHERISRLLMDWRWTDNGGQDWGQLIIPGTASNVSSDLKNHEQIVDVTRFIPQVFFGPKYTPNLKPEIIASRSGFIQTQFKLKIEKSICAEENFFEFFNIPFLIGNPGSALEIAESVVLSQRMAASLFGNENPQGQLVEINGSAFQVTGVFQDLPRNSHLQFDMAFSNSGSLSKWNEGSSLWAIHYFKMKGDVQQLTAILNENKERLIGKFLKSNQHIKIDFLSQPLAEIIFSENLPGDTVKVRSKFTLSILKGVSLVVLIMAWLNYINLTVSKTKTRFKEIAARKVSGALTTDLFLQFICQSMAINILAILIGVTLIQLVRSPFDLLLNIHVIPVFELSSGTLLFFTGIFIIGILTTAAYPAWVTLQYTARQLISRDIPARKRIMTSILTTFQYVAALILIIWIFVMYAQLNFILSKDIGVDKENVIVVEAPIIGLEDNGNNKMVDFARQIRNALHTEVSLSGRVCGDFTYNTNIRRIGKEVFYGLDSHGGVDENFIPFYKLKILAGRNFHMDEKKECVIVSRLASERLGFYSPEEAIGARVEFRVEENWKVLEIIGVVADYRVAPFYASQNSTEDITGRGQCLTYMNNVWTNAVPQRMALRVSANQVQRFVERVEAIYNSHFPNNIYNWYFLNEHINRQYGEQKITRNQITFFTVLAVGVACLGLLGMISNKVVEKMKEISIRRILGAGVRQVTGLLISSTIRQIIIATAIGLPVAWKFSLQYLQGYTEHISMKWWHFTTPVAILVSIMVATIASVLLKAARTNPLESLRHE